MFKNMKNLIIVLPIAGVVCSLLALVIVFPFHPVTLIGWIIWYLLATPVLFLGELIGEKVFSEKVGKRIDSDTSRISGNRIFALLMIYVVLLAVGIGAQLVVYENFGEFIDANFSSQW